MNRRPIAALPEALGSAALWRRIRAAGERLLALDYDGTLAPFTVERMAGRPLPGVLAEIERIRDQGGARLALLSGRPLDELLALIGDLRITLIGSHGCELRSADGALRSLPPPPELATRLDTAYRLALELVPPHRVERKLGSVALHTRGLIRAQARLIERRGRQGFDGLVGSVGLIVRRFNGGVELRATARNKGTALAELLDELPADGLAVYVGDDETDEDAFAALAGRGVGIKVGRSGDTTAADLRLANCRSVVALLRRWPDPAPPLAQSRSKR